MINRPFLIPIEGEALDYDPLLSAWVLEPVPFSPCPLAGDFLRTLVEVTKAIVFNRHITLYDAGFSTDELQRLGATPDRLAETELLAPLSHAVGVSVGSDISHLRERSACRITLFTSGSTGLPKQVTHGLQNLARGVRISPRHAEDVWAFAYNPTHIAGLQVFFQAFFNRNPLVDVYQLPAMEVRQRLLRYQVTHLSATPTFYRLLLEDATPILSVKGVTLGGERAEASLLERVRQLFPNARVHNIYASTEAGTLLVADGECFRIAEESAGVVRLQGGHLQVHRSVLGTFDGAAGEGDAGPAGDWYDTGDVVEACAEAPDKFRIVGREREWINVGGSKVNPMEVEEVLAGHPSVLAVRIYGRKNSLTGELVCGDVVSRQADFDEQAVLEYAAQRLQPFKVPRILKQVSHLEQTRTGKVKRHG